MWAAAMSNLKSKSLIQIDDETEQWIRKQMQMPRRTTSYEAEEPGGIIENIQKRIDVVANQQQQQQQHSGGNGGGAASSPGSGAATAKGPTGETTGNVGKSPSSGV
jgi:hypothetical protein